jgi:nucleotide-binding universal stress UspA family protein
MVERVLVAVDGGEASHSAMEWALARARHKRVRIEIVTVEEVGWTRSGSSAGYRTAYEQALWSALQQAERAPVLDTQVLTTMLRGTPADEVLRASGEADLVVMGADRPRRLAGVFHGSLALRIAAGVHCPLVVVPSGWEPGDGAIVAGIAVDASDVAALAFAAAEASARGGSLVLLHAVSLPRTISLGEFVSPLAFEDLVDVRTRAMDELAGGLSSDFPALDIRARVDHGVAARVLAEAGRGSEMIVVGTHGRTAFGGRIIGSVSHDVLLNIPCPVAVVPPLLPGG